MQQRLQPWAFVLAVPDLQATAGYFRDVLGFRISWDDASEWRLAQRDGVRLMIGHCPSDVPPAQLGSHSWFGYIELDDVDAFHAEIAERGATYSVPADRSYGMREIVVTTVDGHRTVFAQERPASGA